MKVISMIWIITGHSIEGYRDRMFLNKQDIKEVYQKDTLNRFHTKHFLLVAR